MEFDLIDVNVCPICSSNDSKVRFVRNQFKALKCLECGLIYLDKRLKDLSSFYQDDRLLSYSLYYNLSHISDSDSFRIRISMIESYLRNKGELLDVGCNIGTFLNIAANEFGWKHIMGIEPNSAAVEYCRQFNIPVINDFFNNLIASKLRDKFDAVYLGDVIEHVPDPVEIVKNIYTTLKKDGIVLVITPNFDSIVARIFQIKPFEHILYFTNNTLRNLFEKQGFEVVLSKRTTRNRSFEALMFGTSITSGLGKFFLKLIIKLHLGDFINKIIRSFVRDEVLLIARK